MTWRVIVQCKPKFIDHRGKSLEKEWRGAFASSIKKIRAGQAYEISGDLSRTDVCRLTEKLLTDPVTQAAAVFPAERMAVPKGARCAQIWPRDGVSDPVAETVKVGARDLDFKNLEKVRSGAAYEFWGPPSVKDVKTFCENHLMNDLIQRVEIR